MSAPSVTLAALASWDEGACISSASLLSTLPSPRSPLYQGMGEILWKVAVAGFHITRREIILV